MNKQPFFSNIFYFSLIGFLLIAVPSCQQKQDKQATAQTTRKPTNTDVPTFLLYGELFPDGYAEEKDSLITKKFGFRLKRIADCEVTTQIINRTKGNNKKSDALLIAKYGKNWKQLFEEQTKLKLYIPETDKQ